MARAPIGYSLHMAEQFSPALFYRSMLGVFSASAGALTVLGVVALCAASVLWRRGLARRWWNVVGAAGLVLAAPFLVRYLGRGIAPPAGGVGFALWMSWEAAVATAAMALVLTAAALVRGGRDPPAEAPRTPGELYAWWLASPLAEDDYPASLALWTPAGEPEAEIRLASVDLPPSLMAALVRSPETARGPRVERLDRNYGVHYVLVLPLGGGAEVLTVGVGPRTRLIPAARVARFLQGAASVQPPYQITLSPPGPAPATASARVIWTRTGWS